jgi:hypothetical protein
VEQAPELVEPTETIQMPAPSWAPALLAFGVLGLVAGIFATGFIVPVWSYAVLGAIFAFFGLRGLIKQGRRSFYGLPREQKEVRAELPVESFTAPSHD